MAHVIEFQGRLARTDGRDVAAGRMDLRFRLHLAQEGAAHLWEERHAEVRIATGGGYSVLLGSAVELEAALFEEERWLGVYLERGGCAVEVGDRVRGVAGSPADSDDEEPSTAGAQRRQQIGDALDLGLVELGDDRRRLGEVARGMRFQCPGLLAQRGHLARDAQADRRERGCEL